MLHIHCGKVSVQAIAVLQKLEKMNLAGKSAGSFNQSDTNQGKIHRFGLQCHLLLHLCVE